MTTRKVVREKIHRGLIQRRAPPPPNPQLFQDLYYTLRVILYDTNIRGTARILGITPRTALAWTTRTPPSPYINILLRHVIREEIKFCEHHKSKAMRRRALEAKEYLTEYCKETFVPTADANVQLEEDNTIPDETCTRFLLTILSERGYISTKDLRKGRFSKYTISMYRRAAKQLCLDQLTRGFGDGKETVYLLPGEPIPPADYTESRSYQLYVNKTNRGRAAATEAKKKGSHRGEP